MFNRIKDILHTKGGSRIAVFVLYLVVNLIFAQEFWSQTLYDRSIDGRVYGEVVAVEANMEGMYQNMVEGKNPFVHRDALFFPFGTHYLTTDSGAALLFPLIRPFLSTHQSYSLLVALYFLPSNIGMYALLRACGIKKGISFMVGLMYGYMTFLMPRMGHVTYIATWIFPWVSLSLYHAANDSKSIMRMLWAAIAGFMISITLFFNLYYFVIVGIAGIGGFIAGLMLYRWELVLMLQKRIKEICIFVIAGLFIGLPWLKVLMQTSRIEPLPQTDGWAGAIKYSADLTNFFIPSTYSYFLSWIPQKLGQFLPHVAVTFEDFAYPGVFVLFSLLLAIHVVFKKSTLRQFKLKLLWFITMAVVFMILSLGPFLHVFGKWGLPLDTDVRLVVPLPFAAFHYLPFMDNIRAPARLIVGTIFFGSIVGAFLLQRLYLKGKKYRIMLGILLCVFVVDHYFTIPTPPVRMYPRAMYQKIAQDQAKDFSVYEIPSVIRDGFIYFGDSLTLDFMDGYIIHKKPVVAGYMGRMHRDMYNYYLHHPFTGYVGRVIDPALEFNGGLLEEQRIIPEKPDQEYVLRSIDFLHMKYIVVDTDKPYAESLTLYIQELGFKQIEADERYRLFMREPEDRSEVKLDLSSKMHAYMIGVGWRQYENDARWVEKKSSMFVRTIEEMEPTINLTVMPIQQVESVDVYVNREKVGTVSLENHKKKYSIRSMSTLEPGLHELHFVYSTSRPHNKIDPKSSLRHDVSAKVYDITLSND